ncbi:MAG: TRAP transporter small permease subunit [Yoonia sp.]|uniref:TRAP transporter small permease subunit n=1 Tax=Yoonia sp. TaxID=2212373 RepID=UPI003299CA60
MTDTKTPLSVEEVLAISDPGDVNRENHTKIDRFVINVGNVIAWAFPLLMVAIVAQVLLRANGHNQAWLDDLQWWIYGVAMLAAFGYAITTSSHVRVDIFHQNYSDTKKAKIEAAAIGWLLLPFIALMTDVMSHYAWASIESGEGSSSPNGLHRLYILKTSLPFLFALAWLAGYSTFKKNLAVFSNTGLAKQLIWLFPTAVFMGWRFIHYILYWVIFVTDDEIRARRITREYEIFEYAMYISLAIVVALIVIGLVTSRRKGDV